MDRRAFLEVVTLGILLAPLAAGAQQASSVPRLCYLVPGPPGVPAAGSPDAELRNALLQGLRDLGYVDGQNITIDSLYADGRFERFPALAAECLRLLLLRADEVIQQP